MIALSCQEVKTGRKGKLALHLQFRVSLALLPCHVHVLGDPETHGQRLWGFCLVRLEFVELKLLVVLFLETRLDSTRPRRCQQAFSVVLSSITDGGNSGTPHGHGRSYCMAPHVETARLQANGSESLADVEQKLNSLTELIRETRGFWLLVASEHLSMTT